MGMAALAMVIVFTFLLFQKFVLLIAPLLWLAASKSRKFRRKIMSKKYIIGIDGGSQSKKW